MAKFTSENRGLVLQDEDGVYAQFQDGQFETDDPKVAARLRKIDYVSEVKGSATVEDPELPETPLVVGDPPPANASKASWIDYAAAHGMLREEAEGKSVKELREHFNNLRPVVQDTPGQQLVPPSQPRPNAQDPAKNPNA